MALPVSFLPAGAGPGPADLGSGEVERESVPPRRDLPFGWEWARGRPPLEDCGSENVMSAVTTLLVEKGHMSFLLSMGGVCMGGFYLVAVAARTVA